jgi:hypothetical protein
MAEQVEIIKQVKLTAEQRIALIAAANADGVLKSPSFNVRETLRYLGLIEQTTQYVKADIEKRTANAWRQLAVAVRTKEAKKAEDLIGTIMNEKWDIQRTCWRLTAAASEYLLKGRVIVTVGPRNEADMRARRSA